MITINPFVKEQRTQERESRATGRPLASELTQLRQKNFFQLAECFQQFIPDNLLQQSTEKAHSRQRIFSKANTFWAFFSQVIDPDGGCTEVVRKLRDYTSAHTSDLPAASTSAYCQARKKLEPEELMAILKHTAGKLDNNQERGYLNNRRVIVADDTAIRMPATPANKKAWPLHPKQNEARELPAARICACFSLATGGLLSFKMGAPDNCNLLLHQQQSNTFKENDILLGNKNFCRYFDLATLKQRRVDSVVILARSRPYRSEEAAAILNKDDLLISWGKPARDNEAFFSQEQWDALPRELEVRQVHVTLRAPGLPNQSLYLLTTLLDAKEYTPEKLMGLYLQRWNVELFFRDIQSTMGMTRLRCKTPEMVTNEIIMHFIAYNSVRMLIHEAA